MIKYKKEFDTFERPTLSENTLDDWERLDKNEAPYSAKIPQDLLKGVDIRTYPDPYPAYLEIAEYYHLEPANFLFTYGSEQAIRYCFELMIEQGDEVVCLDPTFAMIPVFCAQFGAKSKTVKFNSDRSLDISYLIEQINSKTRLVCIPNPNNPTGTQVSSKDLKKILEKCEYNQCLLMIDEAYYHYCSNTAVELITSQNIVITRTFSKAWGAAGIRFGYMVGHQNVILKFRKLKPIDENSSYSLAVIRYLLSNDVILWDNINHVSKWKEIFYQLNNKNINVLPSEGNYVLIQAEDSILEKLRAFFTNSKIKIKDRFTEPSMKNIIRFGICGRDELMDKILQFCQKVG